MKIVRVITYEGTEAQLQSQMNHSLKDGVHKPGAVTITIASRDMEGSRENGWWSSPEKP